MASFELEVFPSNVVAGTPIPLVVLSSLNAFAFQPSCTLYCSLEVVGESSENGYIKSCIRTIPNEGIIYFAVCNVLFRRVGSFTLIFKLFGVSTTNEQEQSTGLVDERASIRREVQVGDGDYPTGSRPGHGYTLDGLRTMVNLMNTLAVNDALRDLVC